MCAGSRAEKSTYLQVNGKVLRRMQAMMEDYPQKSQSAKRIQNGWGKEVNVELFLSPVMLCNRGVHNDNDRILSCIRTQRHERLEVDSD